MTVVINFKFKFTTTILSNHKIKSQKCNIKNLNFQGVKLCPKADELCKIHGVIGDFIIFNKDINFLYTVDISISFKIYAHTECCLETFLSFFSQIFFVYS